MDKLVDLPYFTDEETLVPNAQETSPKVLTSSKFRESSEEPNSFAPSVTYVNMMQKNKLKFVIVK